MPCRFQFSLRTLLIVTTVCASLFAVLARWSYKAQQQREAVEALQGKMCLVKYDFQQYDVMAEGPSHWPSWLVNVLGVDYFASAREFGPVPGTYAVDNDGRCYRDINDDSLQHVKALQTLHVLNLGRSFVTDAGLEHLKGLTELQSLVLDTTHVTDAGLEHLKELKAMQYLSLQKTKVNDAGVARLQKALPNCKITSP
ncbi:MAG: hypothetical protein K8T91_10030 [Planctomycetes bacterium]|nr:hypothetical protein [Planctomycetota bacterium]